MFHHMIFTTPFGPGAIVFRESPFALFKILLPRLNPSDLEKALLESGWGISGSDKKALDIKNMLLDYFKGYPIHPPWERLDFGGLTSLQKSVLRATADIPYGETRSYRDIATAIGRPNACRFVGTTLAKNPFPILIPCHRIIRSDNSLGKFGGGTGLKKRLIALESKNSRGKK